MLCCCFALGRKTTEGVDCTCVGLALIIRFAFSLFFLQHKRTTLLQKCWD